MRKKEKEITDIGEIESIIAGGDVCRIGFVDGDEPYIVPVSFGYDGKAIYFHCALEGRKIDLIRKNSRVCFELDADAVIRQAASACDWGVKYRSVMGTGRASLLTDNKEKVHGLNVIMKHYSPTHFSFPPAKLDSTLVVRIDVESISGKKSGY